MPDRLRSVCACVAVMAVGAAPRIIGLGTHPGQYAWDEAYYVPAARKYLHGDYSVNLEHPPLGKWLIAASIKLFGDTPAGWRVAPTLFGFATIALTWIIAYRLLKSRVWASVAALLVSLDGLMITSSRTALLDSFLPALILGAVVAAMIALEGKGRERIGVASVTAGVLLGAAMSVKWQAAPALAGGLALWIAPRVKSWKVWRTAFVSLVATPIAVYVAAQAGPLIKSGFDVGELASSQMFALRYHMNFRATHQTASPAWTWLWLRTPSIYTYTHGPKYNSKLTNLGNPGLWWTFIACMPMLAVTWWKRAVPAVNVVALGFGTLCLPWIVVLRPGFSFYLTPFVPFMALGVAYCAQVLWSTKLFGRALPVRAVVSLALASSVVAFGFYYPWWMDRPQTHEQCERLVLLEDWRC